ncbi:MAG: hypothetical protein HQL56_00300 [Magnetococcales bacterium]|nr:hypothetical protein [Magnetococcales bacterium]
MKILYRFLLLVLAVVAGGLMPFQMTDGVSAYTRYQEAKKKLEESRRIQSEMAGYRKRVEVYGAFSEQVRQYLQSARSAGVDPVHWSTYAVDIRDQAMSVAQMRTILDNARHGGNYYFQPVTFSMVSPTLQGMDPKQAAALQKAVQGEVGNSVVVNLKGSYLVYRK